MKSTFYVYPDNLYRFVEVLDEAGVAQLNYTYRRRIAEDDTPDFKVGQWLLECPHSGHVLILEPKWVQTHMVKVKKKEQQ